MNMEEAEKRYPNWREWWLTARFKEAYPQDIPTPGHLQVFAAITDGLGSPWNIPTKWQRCKWYHSAKGAVSFSYYGHHRGLASFDFNLLTDLVLSAHKHAVRVEVLPCNPQYLKLVFWPRDPRKDGADRLFEGHPTLDQLVERINKGARFQNVVVEAAE